jgi:ATP-dependent protease ClpP protease subunit
MMTTDADELLKRRIILLQDEITDDSANEVVAKLLYLDFADEKSPVQLRVNSPGGSFVGGLSIHAEFFNNGPSQVLCQAPATF